MAKIRPLSEELQQFAIAQLHEVQTRVPDDIEALRTWIDQQPHLRARTDDQFLLSFLRGCKFSLEKAKSKIDKFYMLRTKYPELFDVHDVNAARFRELLRFGVNFYLPTPLHDNGPRISVVRSGAYPADKYAIEEVSQVLQALQEIVMIEDDYANVNGVVVIIDMANSTSALLFQMTPSVLKKITHFSEQAVPLRPKASHFFNSPAGFEPIFKIIKPMLSAKQQKRIFVHGNKLTLLHEQIPKKYLPQEYGGENGTIADLITYWDKKMDEYADYFLDNANYGTDEKLRPGNPVDFENIFGIEGSFRKLNVD